MGNWRGVTHDFQLSFEEQSTKPLKSPVPFPMGRLHIVRRSPQTKIPICNMNALQEPNAGEIALVDALDDVDTEAEAIACFENVLLLNGARPSQVQPLVAMLKTLSRFGRRMTTRDRPFYLTMLRYPEYKSMIDFWLREFCEHSKVGYVYYSFLRDAVEAFQTGFVWTDANTHPDDAEQIRLFMTSASDHVSTTAGPGAVILRRLSRFGRAREGSERRFSLAMLADPEQSAAANAWLHQFLVAEDPGPSLRTQIENLVQSLSDQVDVVGVWLAEKRSIPNTMDIAPQDRAAITDFMIRALDDGIAPTTAGTHAGVLQLLSWFGQKRQTDGRLFSLSMLTDPEQQQAADELIEDLRAAPGITSTYHLTRLRPAVKAFRDAHARTGSNRPQNTHPDDLEAIKLFMRAALDCGNWAHTAGQAAVILQAFSRFCRARATADQGFSLMMFFDPAQKQAGCDWQQKFLDHADTCRSHRERMETTMNSFLAGGCFRRRAHKAET